MSFTLLDLQSTDEIHIMKHYFPPITFHYSRYYIYIPTHHLLVNLYVPVL